MIGLGATLSKLAVSIALTRFSYLPVDIVLEIMARN